MADQEDVVVIMKEKLISGAAAVLNVIYSVLKLLPVQKKITYISRQSNTLPVDFQLVMREMKRRHPDYRQVPLIRMIGKGVRGKISYCFHIFCQMYHIATSEMIVLDTYCIAVSLLRQRDSLIVIQMWHALGAMKKFGCSILDKEEGTKRSLAEAMRMHKNYTYVFTSSKFCAPFFAEAFHVPLEKMVVMPLPRLDLLKDRVYVENVKKRIAFRYPGLLDSGKKILVYAPTFRKEGGSFEEEELKQAAERLAAGIDQERYQLVVKFHPLSDIVLKDPSVIQDREFSTIDFCQIADAVILDYSAVMFEVALLGKPMYFYTFDYDSYMRNRDVYLNFRKDIPGVITGDVEELLQAIERHASDSNRQMAFRDQMVSPSRSGSYTVDVADFFEKVLAEYRTEERR